MQRTIPGYSGNPDDDTNGAVLERDNERDESRDFGSDNNGRMSKSVKTNLHG